MLYVLQLGLALILKLSFSLLAQILAQDLPTSALGDGVDDDHSTAQLLLWCNMLRNPVGHFLFKTGLLDARLGDNICARKLGCLSVTVDTDNTRVGDLGVSEE